MRHRFIPAADPYRRYTYKSISRFTGTSTVTIPDPLRKYLAIVINYCTASGTSTTPDTVSPDLPSVTSISLAGVSNLLPVSFAVTLTDNAGTEGTGFYFAAFEVPDRIASLSVVGQNVEDYYGTIVILYEDFGANAATPSFYQTPLNWSGTTPTTASATNPVVNSNWQYWIKHVGGTANLAIADPAFNVFDFNKYCNGIIAFYHGYDSAASVNPIFKMTGENGTVTPVHELISGGNVFGSEGSNAIAIYNGTVVTNPNQINLEIKPDPAMNQGDCVLVVQF